MLNKSKSLLIVTDIQGKLAHLMHEKEPLFKNIGIMIDGIRALDIPILWIEQYPDGLGPTIPEIAAHLDGISPMPKKTFSVVRDPDIKKRFDELNCSQIILIGIETHICIQQTAHDCLSWGNEVHVVEDAVSSRTEFNKRIGLDKIARAGGVITSMETALFELLEKAEGDAFKNILRLVK